MTIAILPETTSRVLRSTNVITKPTSLIKELIDNAIDAKASSVDILISTNTLDRIEVRDNGHGIASDDLDVLGRHGYTSKLRNLEELRTIGGSRLGFRGEALASAVELGDVTITTRTEGDTAGVTINLRASGGIASQTSASHPIGTTVCVSNFLSKIPVRKELALKESKRTLSAIKVLIQTYALARLNLRLSLKVLKNEKANWSFYPRPDDGIRGIASQIVGRDTAAQCIEKTNTFYHPRDNYCIEPAKEDESIQHSKFLIEAFLPSPNADASKIVGGQYISVDSRPVSCSRGTSKNIISAFKSHIRAIGLSDMKSPFIRLNIICAEGSYDPNVEPAKDDVLFEDEQLLLATVDNLFENVYGNSACAKTQLVLNQNKRPEMCLVRSDVTFQKANSSAYNYTGLSAIAPTTVSVGSKAARAIDSSNCITDNEVGRNIPRDVLVPNEFLHASGEHREWDEHTCVLPSAISIPVGGRRRDAKSSGIIPLNPWIIAKLNASTAKRDTKSSSIAYPSKNKNGKEHSFTPFEFPTPVQSSGLDSPHQSRYNAAIAALDPGRSLSFKVAENKPFESPLVDGDPRAYLIRRQKSAAESSRTLGTVPKLKRVKTMLLPLEATPEHAKLHTLVQVVAVNIGSLGKAQAVLANHDWDSVSENYALGSPTSLDIPRIERKLEELLKRYLKGIHGTGGEQISVPLDLSQLQGKSVGAV